MPKGASVKLTPSVLDTEEILLAGHEHKNQYFSSPSFCYGTMIPTPQMMACSFDFDIACVER
ncbi:hypothetical protein F9C07_10987 [Aspergillus flavus]|uniref:Uncharacterized protein n=1 Tax=Aspergillus flavus (strain ATCC 200026 / FGSC A1120 / IAM 13836 / NRRL 3357 / JCM 12722 / SRRC 167) TaxID=332952 RepID=A0A7U2QXW6_ASPFN|nr:hypothetical protein F9C07_10987 [Aspergillus flavus]